MSEVQKAENKDGETTYDFLFDGRYELYLFDLSKQNGHQFQNRSDIL